MIATVSSCIDCGDVTGAAPPENATLSRSFEPSHTVATCACSDAAAPTCETPCPKPARIGQKFWLSPFTSELSCTNAAGSVAGLTEQSPTAPTMNSASCTVWPGMPTSYGLRLGFKRSDSADENWLAGSCAAEQMFVTGAGKIFVDVGASSPPMPGGLISGSGDFVGSLIVLMSTPLACSQSSAKNPCSCVRCTGPIWPSCGSTPSTGRSAPISPLDCTPAVKLSPTPAMLSFCTGARVPALPTGGTTLTPPPLLPPPLHAASPKVSASAAATRTRAIELELDRVTAESPSVNRCRIEFALRRP